MAEIEGKETWADIFFPEKTGSTGPPLFHPDHSCAREIAALLRHALLPYGNDGEALAEKVLEIVKDGQAIHDWKGAEVDAWKKAPRSFLEYLKYIISHESNERYE